ncbi:CvpA family protein [Caldovatus aquaticus]|uniref:CvpA family protein n=1 Tax=Caldovatus aquaticus TaxID=2865671 RepID=A0ABS7F564_9PROT|nr:CvpA family protein [Caldovatus aquaticus]MBW8270768.1 CvpA family protein [Caldovatus aquaticus]
MNWVDGAVLAILAVSAILAFFRGLVREVLGIGAWIGAAVAAFLAWPQLRPWVGQHVEPEWLANAVAAGGAFLAVLLVLKVIIAWIAARVERSALGGVDRALGLVFGLARGAFLVVLAYILAERVFPLDRWPSAVREARALPLIADGARWLVEQLPPEIRPGLEELPERPLPGLNDLLRPPARDRT